MYWKLSRRKLLQIAGATAASVVLAGPRALAALDKPLVPTGMLTDLLPHALNTTAGQQPRFSWQVPDFGADTFQRFYQLQVAFTPDGFDGGKLVWDSGRRASGASVAVPYEGPALKPRTAYWWRVSSWGEQRSAWSEPTLLATSVEDQWEAKPIWLPPGPVMKDGTLNVRVKVTSVAAGVWFRAEDSANNYMWLLRAGSPGAVRKHICVNGVHTSLGEVKLPCAVTADEWLDLSITMVGSTFTTMVNGITVDITTDSRYATGNIGLRSGPGESQVYDQVTFTAASGAVILDDDFTTDKGTFVGGTLSDGTLIFPSGASSLSSHGWDDTWALLRHEYACDPKKKVAAAVLYVAAGSSHTGRQYVAKVWSNGFVVGHASVRSGTGTAYQAFDITSSLEKSNVLAALCWATAEQVFQAQLEITYEDGSRTTIVSGDHWKARRQEGLLPAKGSVSKGVYTAPLEYWDLRHEPLGWTLPGFDDTGWLAPIVCPAINQLVPAAIEPVRLHDITPSSVRKVSDGHWLVDLGREIVGGLAVQVTGTAGDILEVRLGEELNSDGTVRYQLRAGNTYRETWTLRDGIQQFEHWGYRAFRWVELRTSVDLSAAVIKGRAWKLDWDPSEVSFNSSDPSLDRVWELCRYSIEATRNDLYVDTPTRERAPYEGDALINQLSEYGVQRSYALARWSNDYLVRKGTWPTEYRLMSALSAWQDYLATGDDRQLAKDYDLLVAKNLSSHLDSRGLVSKPPGRSSQQLGDLVDWPDASRDDYVFTNVNTVVNAFQYAAFDALAKCAEVLGKTADAVTLRSQADTIGSAMRTILLDSMAGHFIDGEGTTHSAQHATAFSVALGVADSLSSDLRVRLGDALAAGGMRVSVYGAQFLLEALFRLGRSDAALKLLTSTGSNSWLHMLDSLKATIVTEAWDPALKSNMTFSHAWGSAPANVIARYVLGVQVSSPGAGEFLIRPRIGGLTKVAGTVPSMRGMVKVAVQRLGNIHSTQIAIPPNTQAMLEVEIGAADASRYKATGPSGSLAVKAITDLTGTVLRIGPVGSGTTTVERILS
ncbi:family 78 glycoside hydrolase catalytic domain [Pseudomonas putida]|nr:family 78 glycoside hydrolase catalytic domain [Pseudomonas putida]